MELRPIQALEFSVNWWGGEDGKSQYEWAMQWQHIEEDNLWTYWSKEIIKGKEGRGWISTGQTQPLPERKWLTFKLRGVVLNSQVHYLNFECGDKPKWTFDHAVDKGYVNPVTTDNNPARIGVLLIANSEGQPYDIYIDDVSIHLYKP